MGNCSHCHRSNRIGPSDNCHKKIVLLLVGLDNAGKTTIAKRLTGEPIDDVVSTVGFSSLSLKYKGYTVMIYDLGGGQQIRGIWPRYFMDVHGMIFVVDASDTSRLEECQNTFETLLQHDKLSGKPVLLLANKQDCNGALDELDIVEKLNVERIVNEQRCPTLVETCWAVSHQNIKSKVDPAIHNGYRWLLNCIINNYEHINSRVERDVMEQKKLDFVAKKERMERVRKQREEDRNVVNANGSSVPVQEEDVSDGDVIMKNPFRPITEITSSGEKDSQDLIQETGSENLAPAASHKKRFVKRVNNGSISFGDDRSVISKIYHSVDVNVKKNTEDTASLTEVNRGEQSTHWSPPPGGDCRPQQLPPLRTRHLPDPWVRPSLSLHAKGYAWDLDKSLEIVSNPETNSTQTEESNKL